MFLLNVYFVEAQQNDPPDFKWGNTSYYNLEVGDSVVFDDFPVKLLALENNYNKIEIDGDTLNLKIAQRSLPFVWNGLSIFVADNRNLKKISCEKQIHGLLTKDAIIGITNAEGNLLNANDYIFPITFNHGFTWSGEEDSYLFSLTKKENSSEYCSYPGIGFNLNDARGQQKHWIAAIEDCTVEWIEDDGNDNSACILLKSAANHGIYYVYDRLYKKSLEIRRGQKLQKGEILGTAWGDNRWCYLQFSVLYAESPPTYENRYFNVVNFFPQLYELYYQHSYNVLRSFNKGKIEFGRSPALNGNIQNAAAFEEYLGKGWLFDNWNTAGKLPWVSGGDNGNVRLSKTLFARTNAKCTNPGQYYEYLITVRNGTYRIRAKVGDIEKPSWQKIAFCNVEAGTYELKAGEQKWTSEKVVRISDHKLKIRIYVDQENNTVAGISEIVFQQAY